VTKILMIAGLAIGIVLLLAIVLIRLLENRFIYFPPRYPAGFLLQGDLESGVEEVWLTTEDHVRINAIYLPNPSSRKVLLWFHGNAENIGNGLAHLRVLSETGAAVLAVDYRGYGKSDGEPNEAGVYRDADAAYNYLVSERNFRPVDLIIYGHSLGGAVAIDLAARRACGGLIAQSSFTSARAMARRMFRIPWLEYLPKTRFDSLRKITDVPVPVLVAHGTRDEVVPFAMGEMLFRAALEPKRFYPIEGAGHNDVIEMGGARYLSALATFIRAGC